MPKVWVVAGGIVFSNAEWFAKVTWKLVTPARSSSGTKIGSSSSTRSPS
ncbi:MAG: hypothetical protein ACLTXT_09760 [Ruminococcus callidus]